MPTSNDLNDLKLQVKRSKISVENFKSKSFFGSSKEFASFHKTIGNLAGHVRKVVIRVGSLEKIVNNQSKKIKSLKNISKLQGPQIRGTNIGAKLPGGSTDNLDKTISTIADTISSIAETLKAQKKVSDSANENDRRRREKEKGDAAENKLEKRFEGLKKIAEKIIAPVKSILDKIINFLVNVLLGRVVIKLLDWLADPKNASKVKSIIRFIGDWWPALLGAYVLFGTTFGAFVRGTVGMLGRFIIQIGKVAIPGLLKFIARNPLGAAATALFLTGAGAELVPGLTGKKEEETKKAPGSTKDKIQQLQSQKANLNVFEKLQGKGSEIDEQISLLQTGKTKGYGFSGGGFNGFVSGEKGVDKVPAMLSDGEFVMSRGAVDLYGVDQLMSMNAAGGGTNRPKIIGGVPHADGGGPIGSIYEGVDRASGGKLKPVVDEIIRGLSSQYKWANDLARKTGVAVNRSAGRLFEGGQRIVGEGMKMVNPTIQRGQRIVGEVKKKVDPAIQSALKFRPDLSGIQTVLSNASGAAQEALPALLGSTLGISRTDKSISEDMQRSLLQARNTAGKRGRNDVDYKDYVGGGLSAGGLTMGRIADKEWKRDAKGRIIGLRQVYDTNRSAGEAWDQGMQSWGQFFKSGLRDTGALGRGVYKPAEALLAAVQGRGKTMHDVNFSEKVLGFKPGSEVLSPTQKKMIKEQKNREALQDKRPWWDKMGIFGGGSRVAQEQAQIAKSKPVAKPVKPPAKPQANVVYGPPVPSRLKSNPGGAPKSKVPNFTAGAPGMRSKQQTLGLMR